MHIEIKNILWTDIAVIISDKIEIHNAQEALDLLMTCAYQWSRKILINEKNIVPEFFSLQSGIAWEVLQKVVNYDCCISIVGDYEKFSSQSLKDFIYESNKGGRVSFVTSIDEGIERLIKAV